MIDSDDVGDGFLYGGFVIGAIFLVIYLVISKPVIKECEASGGIIVQSDGKAVCIDKKALIVQKEKS